MPDDAPNDSRSLLAKRWVRVLFVISMLFVGAMIPVLAADLGLTTDPYQLSEGVHLNASNGPEVRLNETIEVDRVYPVDGSTVNIEPKATITGSSGSYAAVSGFDSTWFVLDHLDLGSLSASPANHPEVSVSGGATQLQWRDYTLDDGTADIKLQTSGATTLNLTELSTQSDYITIADSGGTQLDRYFATDANPEFTVSSSGDLHLETADVQFANPDPPVGNITANQSPIELSVAIDHPAFESGDQVDVEFFGNGERIGTVTSSSDGRVSISWSNSHLQLGHNEWYVSVNDSGHVVNSTTWSFETPHDLYLRDELTGQLLDDTNADVEVQFFPEGGDEVIQETTSDGVINLTGLPHDTDIVVRAEVDGYFGRESLIRDLTEQQSMYLLNQSADAVQVEFQLQDVTDDFPEETSRLIIEKPITVGGETNYVNIVGQEFGVGGAQVWLEADQRYRLRVESPDGEHVRSLGSYSPGTAETINLQIDSRSTAIGAPETDIGFSWNAWYKSTDSGDDIMVTYTDADDVTSDLTIRVYNRRNQSQLLYERTETDLGNLTETIPVTGDLANVSTFLVELQGSYDGQDFTVTKVVHADTTVGFLPGWVETAAALFITLLTGALLGGARADLGAVVVSVVAGVFWLIGWLDGVVTGSLVALGLFVALLYRHAVIGRGVRTQ